MYEDLFEPISEMGHYHSRFIRMSAISVWIQVMTSLELIQFSPAANFPIIVMKSAFKDIANFFIVYGIMMVGETLACYLVFGGILFEFSSYH